MAVLEENSLGNRGGPYIPRSAGSTGGPAPWTGHGHGVPIAVFRPMPCAVEFQC